MAFLPWYGVFLLSCRSSQANWKDNVALLRLDRPAAGVTPLAVWRASRHAGDTGHARICGYGRWSGLPGDSGDAGLQRRFKVDFTTSEDTLDLDWTPAGNGGVSSLKVNSGGPALFKWDDRYGVVGVNREVDNDEDDRHRAAWIGRDRARWLWHRVGKLRPRPALPAPEEWFAHQQVAVKRDGPPTVIEVSVPTGARGALVTLNATHGRLQMAISTDDAAAVSQTVASDPEDLGRFLVRELDSELDGEESLRVAVGPSPSRTERWHRDLGPSVADVCVRFWR